MWPYKTLKNKKPVHIYERLKLNEDRRSLRDNLNVQVNGDLTVTRSGFMYRGAKLYNMIPGHIKNIETYGSFKTNIKKWIKQNISIKPQ